MAVQIVQDLEQNIKNFEDLFADCADIKRRRIRVGEQRERECYIAYIEVSLSNVDWEDSAVGKFLQTLQGMPEGEMVEYVRKNIGGISDAQPFGTLEEAAQGMLCGDTLVFLEGYDKALKIPDKGYPGRGVYETESEKIIRGSNEGKGKLCRETDEYKCGFGVYEGFNPSRGAEGGRKEVGGI